MTMLLNKTLKKRHLQLFQQQFFFFLICITAATQTGIERNLI